MLVAYVARMSHVLDGELLEFPEMIDGDPDGVGRGIVQWELVLGEVSGP